MAAPPTSVSRRGRQPRRQRRPSPLLLLAAAALLPRRAAGTRLALGAGEQLGARAGQQIKTPLLINEELPGCEVGLTEKKEITTVGGTGEKIGLFYWNCPRCRAGFVEVAWSVCAPAEQVSARYFPGWSEEALAAHIEANMTFMKQTCKAALCGVDCQTCKTKKKHKKTGFFSYKTVTHYTCEACNTKSPLAAAAVLPEEGIYRIANSFALSETEVVHDMCNRKLKLRPDTFGNNTEAHSGGHFQLNLILLMKHFTLGVQEARSTLRLLPHNVLEVVQILNLIGLRTDAALKEAIEAQGKDVTEAWGDMVEKGVNYQADLLRAALENTGTPEVFKGWASVMARSFVLAQVQGALQLCMEFSTGYLEMARWPDPDRSPFEWDPMTPEETCMQAAKWRQVGARCTRIQGAFSQILSVLESLSGEQQHNSMQEVPDYHYRVGNSRPGKADKDRDLQIDVDAPRRTVIDVLSMLDFFGHPRSVVPAEALQECRAAAS